MPLPRQPQPDPDAPPNLSGVYDGEPVFVRSGPNAKLYQVGTANDSIHVLHLWGAYRRRTCSLEGCATCG